MAKGLSIASWACFVLAAAMLRSPSPLLLVLVPGQFGLGLAAFFFPGATRTTLAVNALLMALNYAFLFKQTFLN